MLGPALFGIRAAAEGVQINHCTAGEMIAEILPLAYKIAQVTGYQAGLQQTVQLQAHFLGTGAGAAVKITLVTEDQHCIPRDVIHGGGHFGIDVGHVTVGCRVLQTVFVLFKVLSQGLDQRVVGISAPLFPCNTLLQIGAETGQTLGMEPGLGLANGQDHDIFCVFRAALGIRVKKTHGVQLVAKEFDSDRLVGCRGVYIQNTAPDGKLTGTLHHAAAAVTGGRELFDQIIQFVFTARLQAEGCASQHLGRHGPLAQGFPGEDLQLGLTTGQVEELPQSFLLPCPGYHGSIIECQFPAGQNGRDFSEECFQLLLQSLGSHVVLADEDDGTAQILAQPCDQMAAVDLADAGDSGRGILVQCFQKRCVFRNCFQKRQ